MGQYGNLLRQLRERGEAEQAGRVSTEWRRLLQVLPKGSRGKTLKKIANLILFSYFSQKESVNNFHIAQCLKKRWNTQSGKLTRRIYKSRKTELDEKVKNRFRTLKKYWKSMGYDIEFNKERSKIVNAPFGQK
ncbi:MAG: hypothetical protein A3F31_00575 [Candidatus Levybacteria bacterium RIFCSPHIGHO2_12_FULL_38_12]|nr:MAG: hypothetical protein A2770_02870 [Candidatus Levybacteria bacterium RIFCSPHIGHO2_01_FULL_38_12]OGH22760.1 MAG: hypothetical protein A3F31_00575 [Candidatus Levybacteria bacterium RIFCSPHIGHO2_12_FULL_38_12]OGH45013.1 MAG: hypothetical protein A3J14_04010 [Candidatus Levybacteria bacterium RIFCSPLOWO2_02_FULL_37_18]